MLFLMLGAAPVLSGHLLTLGEQLGCPVPTPSKVDGASPLGGGGKEIQGIFLSLRGSLNILKWKEDSSSHISP